MSFPRPHPPAPEAAAETPPSTFTYKTFGGKEKTVQAHYVNFMPGHVAFCREDEGSRQVIVLAEVNTNVHELREVQ